jgi:hypothetical protein
MPIAGISLGTGLGGGTSATISGSPGGGGGGFTNGASVDFDGVDDHATPASTITLSGNKSISFWAYLDVATGYQNFISPGGVYYGLLANANTLVYCRTGAGVRTFSFGGSPWSAGVWNHWAVTGDGSDLILYINGTAVGGVQADGDISIAKFFAVTGYYFIYGKIDEFACFNSTLSPSDVSTITNAGGASGSKAIDLSGYSPVHWWRMGDINGSSGTTIADQGSGGVAMTLVNSPAYSASVP